MESRQPSRSLEQPAGTPDGADSNGGSVADPLGELKASIWGNVLVPKDGERFQKALEVWSVSPFRGGPPAIVVQARGTQDVVDAVKYARKHGMQLSVKAGGHGAGNPSCVEGGLVVDLSLMRSCHVDMRARVATVDGGCLLGDIDRETALYGLAVPLGTAPVTGMGLIVNGGSGILSRMHGAACSSILEAQLVMADGTLVDVNEGSDPELLWAVRGAASCLGVVTRMKLQLYDVSETYTGILSWPDDPDHANFRAVARWMRDQGSKCPHLGINLLRMLGPRGPQLMSMVVHTGSESREEKEAFFKPLRDLGPTQDTLGRWQYHQTQACMLPELKAMKAAVPVHYEYLTGGSFLEEQFTEEVLDAMVDALTDGIPMPECALTLCALELLGGAISESSAPYGYSQGLAWVLQVGWLDPAHHELGVGYAKKIKASLGGISNAVEPYANFSDYSPGEALDAKLAAVKVGGAVNLARLEAVKVKYDPANVFGSTPFRRVLQGSAERCGLNEQ